MQMRGRYIYILSLSDRSHRKSMTAKKTAHVNESIKSQPTGFPVKLKYQQVSR